MAFRQSSGDGDHHRGTTGICAFAVLIVLLTLLGYRAIHFVGRVASVIGVAAFVFMFARLFAQHDIGALLDNRHFSIASFLLSMSLSASWQIAFGPYVADKKSGCASVDAQPPLFI
jgi:nucleobase:cation symporter-1, NCS1 family